MRDETTLIASLTKRTDLVAQAAELCSSLNVVMQNIAPSRFIKSLALDRAFQDSGVRECLHNLSSIETMLLENLRLLDELRNDALTPMSRLPDDILRHIFTLTSPEEWMGGVRRACILTWVCRRWRAVAIDTARLWTHVSLSSYIFPFRPGPAVPWHPWYDSAEWKAREDGRGILFARSKSAPLTMSLALHADENDVSALVDEFVGEWGHRVERLSLHTNNSPNNLRASTLCISATNCTLRKLVVSSEPTFQQDQWDALSPAVGDLLNIDLPHLNEVTLIELPLPMQSATPYLLFLSCESVILDYFPEDQMTSSAFTLLLQSCPKLRNLRLMGGSDFRAPRYPNPVPSQPETVYSPNLTRLTLGGTRLMAMALSIVSAPHLSALALHYADSLPYGPDHEYDSARDSEDRASIVAAARGFLKRAGAIQSLEVAWLPHDIMKEILSLLPGLRRLEYQAGTEDGSHMLRGITASARVGCAVLLPVLEELSLLSWPRTAEEYRDVLRFVHNRKIAGSGAMRPIRRLELGAPAMISPSHVSIDTYRRPQEPLETHQVEEELAEEVDELVVGQAGRRQWVFDKAARAWKPVAQTKPWYDRIDPAD